ncbi:MAG: hypothetical protein U1F87_18915 [Kiritimatiellia bacterium]
MLFIGNGYTTPVVPVFREFAKAKEDGADRGGDRPTARSCANTWKQATRRV